MEVAIKKTGSVTMDEIKAHIEKQLGRKITNIVYHIKEEGDHDKGTYKRWLDKIDFMITDERVVINTK